MSTPSQWLQLQKLVIDLGEIHAWWPIPVLQNQSEAFLAYVLPKTKTAATYRLACEMAKKSHDQVIGAGYYHLFRLPETLEKQIHQLIREDESLATPADQPALQLMKFAADGVASSQDGPFNLGHHSELADPTLFQTMARHYWMAAQQNYQTFPYLG